jgi:hypothetical protein
VCSETTCADCEGVFQGVDTVCIGDDDDECPCDPPADPGQCEKCVDGTPTDYCPEHAPQCCAGVCQSDSSGACCASDGTCTQTCEEECDGTWHSGVTCEGIDCESGCCTALTTDGGVCATLCNRGFIEGCVPCDPDATPEPVPPVYDCLGGTPSTVTVTGSGAVAVSGDPVYDAELNSMLNASYAVDLGCNGSGQASFTGTPGYRVDVVAAISSGRIGSINILILPFGPQAAAMGRNVAGGTPTITECGWPMYPCDPFSGPVTFSGGPVDFTGASIDVS